MTVLMNLFNPFHSGYLLTGSVANSERWHFIRVFTVCIKPVLHQLYGSRTPLLNDKFLGFERQSYGDVRNTTRLPCHIMVAWLPQLQKINFRHVHFPCVSLAIL